MLNITLGLLAGSLIGYSIGIGLKPTFKQPKNLKIQIILGVIGVILLAILILNLK